MIIDGQTKLQNGKRIQWTVYWDKDHRRKQKLGIYTINLNIQSQIDKLKLN